MEFGEIFCWRDFVRADNLGQGRFSDPWSQLEGLCRQVYFFYLEVLNLGSVDGLLEVSEPLKISAEIVCLCVCTHARTPWLDRNLQPSSLGCQGEGGLLPKG